MQQAPFGWPLLQNTQGFALQPADYIESAQNSVNIPFLPQTVNGMQQFAQPLEVIQYGNSWQQVVPSAMPWANVYSTPGVSSDVMQFTSVPDCSVLQSISSGETLAPICSNIAANHGNGYSNLNNLSNITSSTCQPNITAVPSMGITASRTRHLKRLQNGFEGERQRKRIRVNEERMSSGLEQMGLNNNQENSKSQYDDDQSWFGDVSAETADGLIDEDRNIDSELPRLHLSEEVLRSIRSRHGPLAVSQRTKDLVSRMALEELNKPCMQLVLWKPAPSLLIPEPDVTRDTNGENKSEREQADSMEACVSGGNVSAPLSVNSFGADVENTSLQLCRDNDDITDF